MTDIVPLSVTPDQMARIAWLYMHGARVNEMAQEIQVTVPELRRLIAAPEWQPLLTQVRDQYINGTLLRVSNIESRLFDRIEDMLENGIEGMSALGERYTRQLNAKEAVACLGAINQYRKHATKQGEGAPRRGTFNTTAKIAELERFAKATEVVQ